MATISLKPKDLIDESWKIGFLGGHPLKNVLIFVLDALSK